MKKYILLIFLILPVFISILLIKTSTVNAADYPCGAPDQIQAGTPQGACGEIKPGYQCFSYYKSTDANGQSWCDNTNCVSCSNSSPSPSPSLSSSPSKWNCTDGTVCKVSTNALPLPGCCAPLPAGCTSANYKWVIMSTPVNATLYGANNACGDPNGLDYKVANAVCPKNTTDKAKVNPDTSNWCYEFTEGNRCIQLQHIADSPTCGTGGGGTTCTIGGQSPDMGSVCAACLSTKTSPTNVPGVITNIKNMNPTSFNACSNQQILNNWCNAFGATAAQQCNELKTGVCATDCAGSSGGGGGDNSGQPTVCNGQVAYPDSGYAVWNGQCSGVLQAGGSGIGQGCCELACLADAGCDEQYAGQGNCTADCKVKSSTPVPASQTAPACISPASGSTFNPNNVTFSWGAVSGASVYHFRVWDYNLGGWNDANWLKESIIINDLTGTSFSGSGGSIIKNDYGSPINLPAGQNYRYRIAAANASGIGPWADCNFAVSASASVSPSAPPPSAFTTQFRIAESPADFTETGPNGWQPYNTEPIKIDNFEFKTKTPEDKFVWVEFKDTTGKTGGCGLNKSEPCSMKIRLLGPEPTITGCFLGFEGSSTVLNLTGENFGLTKGVVKGGATDLQEVREWLDNNIKVVWPNAPTGQTLNVTLTTSDGQSVDGSCSAISPLALGARIFCRQPFAQQTDNVELILAGAFEGGTLLKQTVSIDKDGVIQGLNIKLEAGKRYILSLKAPKSLRRNISFTAEEGTTNISGFVLPVGDIFPAATGDGKINSFDKGQLNTQFILTKDACSRFGDFNRDCRVNSIDWACMRVSMPDAACSGDNPAPVPGPQADIPAQTCQIVGNASSSPLPNSSPTASPSPSPI